MSSQNNVQEDLNKFITNILLSLISTAKQTFEPSFPGEPIVQKNPVEKPFSIEFPRPDNPSRFTEQPYVSIHCSVCKKTCMATIQAELCLSLLHGINMVIGVVKFSSWGYKIRKILA